MLLCAVCVRESRATSPTDQFKRQSPRFLPPPRREPRHFNTIILLIFLGFYFCPAIPPGRLPPAAPTLLQSPRTQDQTRNITSSARRNRARPPTNFLFSPSRGFAMGFIGVYQALYDYEPQSEGELVLAEGDLLYILEKSAEDAWWKAKKKAGEDEEEEPEGLIPNTYVEEVSLRDGAWLRWV